MDNAKTFKAHVPQTKKIKTDHQSTRLSIISTKSEKSHLNCVFIHNESNFYKRDLRSRLYGPVQLLNLGMWLSEIVTVSETADSRRTATFLMARRRS